jgi:hypothetical protein
MRIAVAAAAAFFVAFAPSGFAQDAANMSFFVTSAGPGDGANLGGLAGADAHCAMLAEAAGSTGKDWRAYLSGEGVNARDRIGAGPWINVAGVTIATNLDNLHSEANNLSKETALTETGAPVKGRGDEPNQHDILTGSNADGTLATGQTCGDWTSNGDGAAMVGHADRMGPASLATGTSWNAAHASRGCSQDALIGTGGNGYFYCFAAN